MSARITIDTGFTTLFVKVEGDNCGTTHKIPPNCIYTINQQDEAMMDRGSFKITITDSDHEENKKIK